MKAVIADDEPALASHLKAREESDLVFFGGDRLEAKVLRKASNQWVTRVT